MKKIGYIFILISTFALSGCPIQMCDKVGMFGGGPLASIEPFTSCL